MKNIHVLPTDKPSRFFNTNKGEYHFREHYAPDTMQTCKNHNIYITSDEEIKEGDWFIKTHNIRSGVFDEVFKSLSSSSFIGKKIILTTDQDLIKDGVQAIDNEFLEWFVQNPSCEEVEIVYDYFQVNQNNQVLRGSTSLVKQHKIITPKEYPNELEPVLAKITHQNDLGKPKWYEVVYYVDGKWCSYSGSKTFEDGERVVEWVHCHTIFQNTNNLITFKSE